MLISFVQRRAEIDESPECNREGQLRGDAGMQDPAPLCQVVEGI